MGGNTMDERYRETQIYTDNDQTVYAGEDAYAEPSGQPSAPPPTPPSGKHTGLIIGIIAAVICLIAMVVLIVLVVVKLLVPSEKEEDSFINASSGFVDSGDLEYVVLHAEASDGSSAVAYLYSGERIEIYELDGNWYHVRYGDIEGYIRVTDVVFTLDGTVNMEVVVPETMPEEVTIPAETLPEVITIQYDSNGIAIPSSYPEYMAYREVKSGYCSAESTDMYKEASTGTSRGEAFKLYEDDAVTILGICNSFYYITVEGGSGYDVQGYVSVSSITLGVPPKPDESYYDAKEGYVSVKSCHVRSSRSKVSDSNIIDTLYEGTIFTIDSFDGYWYHINYPGRSGYISYKMVKPGKSPDIITPKEGYVSNETCNVRCSPDRSDDSNIVDTLSEGDVFTATHFEGYWYYIVYDNGSGWVSNKMITIGKPPVETEAEEIIAYNLDSELYGEIEGNGVAGFATSYVCEHGEKETVREDLEDGWHIMATAYCYSMGIEWYEIYDADDGDYYGWVDSNFLTFYENEG